MIQAFIIIGGALMLVAGLSGNSGVRVHPAHHARLTLGALVGGLFLIEAGLVLWSSPVILDVLGLTDLAKVCLHIVGGRVPGGIGGGTAAGIAALWFGGAVFRGGWGVLRTQRTLRVDPALVPSAAHEDFDLFILPSSRRMAYTVGGRRPQVILTSAVISDIAPELVEAITSHERAHAEHRHHRFLALAAAVEAALGWLYPVARAISSVRLSLERWADEEASLIAPGGRQRVRQALLTACLADGTRFASGFGGAEMVAARLAALDGPAPTPFSAWLAGAYVAFGAGAVVAVASVAWATAMSLLSIISPGQCLV